MENTGSKRHQGEISTKHSKSPFDLIVNQIWRRKSFAERLPQSSVSRFFKVSENSNEAECQLGKTSLDSENKETVSKISSDELKPPDVECDSAGWKQVTEFMARLGKKPNHKYMNLNNSQLTANDMVQLAALLQNLPNLEELDLSWNEEIGGTLKLLTNHLQHMSQLRVLVLGSCGLAERDVSDLGECIQHLPNIEEIDLSWNRDLGGNLSLLTRMFNTVSKLKILKLIDCNLTADDGRALGKSLAAITRLEFLDLSMNKDVGSGLEILFRELKHVPQLQVLKLHLCGLTKVDICGLGDTLEHVPGMKKLVLSCNDIGGGFKETTVHLLNFKQLQVFDVHQCSLTEDDVCALTDTIPHLTELETLDLSWNKCLGGNLGELFQMWQSNTHLCVLKMCSCNLTSQDLASLVSTSSAGFLENLQKLDLTYNNTIDDQSWAMFFREISGLKELVELDIGLRPFAHRECDLWITVLLGSLTRFPSLTGLGMNNWVLSASQRDLLNAFNKDNKRNIHFAY
ncbi:leucine-rich repeat-containing protein 31-like isoform X2 [Scyliorhinus canicula]|uniref:leucine-rich repeat-containing protein 31-like isoform X2 n=1 Tax=Scyliorhinus canicula TaxID=7830 RepID=UPI0018F5FEF8|nr:leucine-rich repeat-containing protein 31-like isoform X2 [Scyliorhinus canicula]